MSEIGPACASLRAGRLRSDELSWVPVTHGLKRQRRIRMTPSLEPGPPGCPSAAQQNACHGRDTSVSPSDRHDGSEGSPGPCPAIHVSKPPETAALTGCGLIAALRRETRRRSPRGATASRVGSLTDELSDSRSTATGAARTLGEMSGQPDPAPEPGCLTFVGGSVEQIPLAGERPDPVEASAVANNAAPAEIAPVLRPAQVFCAISIQRGESVGRVAELTAAANLESGGSIASSADLGAPFALRERADCPHSTTLDRKELVRLVSSRTSHLVAVTAERQWVVDAVRELAPELPVRFERPRVTVAGRGRRRSWLPRPG